MSQQKIEPVNETGIPVFVEPIESLVGQLFICAFLCNKARDLPVGFLEPILANIAILSLALAYSLQLLTTPFYQQKNKKIDEQLLNYRNICIFIAFVGALSSWVCIIAPQLWLECLWIFCANNLLWIYNENSRNQEPTQFPKMPNNHDAFLGYVTFIGLAPFCSAIAGCLKKSFLNYHFVIDLISKILNWSLTIIGLFKLDESSKLKLN